MTNVVNFLRWLSSAFMEHSQNRARGLALGFSSVVDWVISTLPRYPTHAVYSNIFSSVG